MGAWFYKTATIVALIFALPWLMAAVGGSQSSLPGGFEPDSAQMDLTATAEISPTPTETASPSSTLTPDSVTLTPTPTGTVTPTETLLPVEAPSVPTQEILVCFSSSNSRRRLEDARGITFKDVGLTAIGVYSLDVPADQVDVWLAELQGEAGVVYAEPNYHLEGQDTFPADPAWGIQYNLLRIHAPQGWDISTGSTAVTIAIVDTGVDLSHPDLATKIVPGINILNPLLPPQDDNGHGSHVAGIAAAATNNGLGIAGVSWGARVMPVKVLDATNSGTYGDVASGIIWATDHGAQIINLSLGGASLSSVLQNAVTYAASRGVLLVAAAGNINASNPTGKVMYPAAYPEVLAVAATDAFDNRLAFSAFGPELDLSAPGDTIYSLNIGGSYIQRSGTSMAAPHVAGLAAILWGLPGNASAALVRAEMENSALDLYSPGWDALTGYGLIQMDRTLARVITPTPTLTLTLTLTPTQPAPVPVFVSRATVTPGFVPFIMPFSGSRLTPTPTVTMSPAVISSTPTLISTLSITRTPTSTLTSTATLSVSPTLTGMQSAPAPQPRALFWPCLGLGMISVGFMLFLLSRQARRDHFL